ncbi:MAG: sodium:calcium antiporter, partial [Deltaproteobacteria bacterium]|nr:sodium:calcium antiporter [Deltaproteobacteria bacterium]
RGHLLSAGFGIILIGVAVFSILSAYIVPVFGHVGLYVPVIAIIYIFGVRAVYYYEKTELARFVKEGERERELRYPGLTLKKALYMYALNAFLIVVAATFLPFIADDIASATGLGHTFVGSILVATTTSLPELVVSIAAVRIGAQDLAIANMLGSNMFNILVLAVDDILYTEGAIVARISQTHAVTGVIAIIMTGVVVAALTYPPKKKVVGVVCWYSALLLLLWFVSFLSLLAASGQ